MATYIILANYTEKGIGDIKQSPNRLDAAKELALSLGGEMKAFYLAVGIYDIVAIVDFFDDAAAAKFALILGSKGNVRTTTLKTFSESEFRDIVASLP